MLSVVDNGFHIDPQTIAIIFGVIPAIVGAFGLIIKLVLNALKDQREGFEKFMGNHMSDMTKTLVNLTVTTQRLADGQDQLHEDNLETARVLRREDESTTRKVSEQSGGRDA